MIVGTATLKLDASWVNSLKEKRMIVKSIIDKVKSRFNVSIAEVEEMDTHRTIILGLCCVSNSSAHCDAMLQSVIKYIENNADANLVSVDTEIL